jgi:two-component system, LytTR family, response regulator
MMLQAIIIDDEPDAHLLLEYYCKKSGVVDVIDHCYDGRAAVQRLDQKDYDFVFLDINMPEMSGIALLNVLTHNPPVIFTTAHSQYALEGYEYNTTDYLLKPIRYERFLKAIEKIGQRLYPDATTPPESIVFPGLAEPLFPATIWYVEALGNYIKIHFSDKNLLVHDTMKDAEALLLPYAFVRCHKKYLLNSHYIATVENDTCVLQNGVTIPVGISYRQQVKSQVRLR